MTSQPKILVFGATGTVGREVSSALIRRKVPFRAIVHNVSKAESLKKEGAGLVEIVEADLFNPDSILKAAQGIEVAFLMTPPGRGQTRQGKVAGDILKKAGVKRAVKLSGLGCEEPDKYLWADEHIAVENHLTEIGLPFTSLRPSSFHSNWFFDVTSIKQKNSVFAALGNSKMNFISNYDIGEVAAVALTTEGHEGKIYNITGPDTLAYTDAVAILSAAIGRQITYVPLNEEENRKAAAYFLPPEDIDGWVNMWKYFVEQGGHNQVYDHLEQLTGSKGKSLKQFFIENAAIFK